MAAPFCNGGPPRIRGRKPNFQFNVQSGADGAEKGRNLFATPATPTIPIPNVGKLFIGEKELTSNAKDFEFVSVLGKGSFGIVKKVRHKTGVYLAVKEIVDMQTVKGRARLKDELEIVKKSQECEHIVDYYGVNNRENMILIFMEVMETCMEKIYLRLSQQSKRFPSNVLTYIAISMLKGLMFLEETVKAMHRDVKPSNVLLGKHGEIKLADFGLAKCMDEDNHLLSGVGTHRYLPPERLDPSIENVGYGYESDIWGYGISIVELACLKYPYPLDGVEFHLYTAILKSPAPVIPDTYPEALREFIAATLIKNREQRPMMSSRSPDSAHKSRTTPLSDLKFFVNNADSTFVEEKKWLCDEISLWRSEKDNGYSEVFLKHEDGSSETKIDPHED